MFGFGKKKEVKTTALEEAAAFQKKNPTISRDEAMKIVAHRRARIERRETVAQIMNDNPSLTKAEATRILYDRLDQFPTNDDLRIVIHGGRPGMGQTYLLRKIRETLPRWGFAAGPLDEDRHVLTARHRPDDPCKKHTWHRIVDAAKRKGSLSMCVSCGTTKRGKNKTTNR